jgi:uncharacterized membrane protein YhaH (DUF805 family)
MLMVEMPEIADNGSYAEPRRSSSQGWSWIYAPDGRMRRVDFFYAIFARAFVLALPLGLLGSMIVVHGDETTEIATGGIPLWTFAVLLTAGGPMVRRLHDLGLGGLNAPWLCLSLMMGCALFYFLPRPIATGTAAFFLLALVPYLLVFALMLWPGARGSNRYGPPPVPAP